MKFHLRVNESEEALEDYTPTHPHTHTDWEVPFVADKSTSTLGDLLSCVIYQNL